MSYILEALKKAEHDREIGQVPRIDSEHEPASSGLSPRWVIVVVLVLLINAGLLLVLFWPEEPSSPPPQAAGPAPALQATVTPVTRPENRNDRVVDRALTVAPPAAAVQPPVAVELPTVEPPVRAAEVPVVPRQPVVAATTRPSSGQFGNLPVWPQVPDYILQKLNRGLRLDVHVYSERPEDRFVLVNLQKYREGDQLQEGPLLDAITPDGIVLSLQGDRFLVRAQ
ncbi:general secretion pathway protein B [Thiogranum longum]|uniref:General secretion pathway protein B n=1 Tax=Thiogranum longum TaxID=1537524 RepID=A0A4R1HAJ3_9GAMM|nr:general secretion pathway protein GspB [Thiogranum longum]TCK17185.1 general secretion pathway protein B [Thiogranum longum]